MENLFPSVLSYFDYASGTDGSSKRGDYSRVYWDDKLST
jgi:hypothetical protein